MAFLPGVSEKIINAFNGAILRLDARTVPNGNALFAANSAYMLGAQVGTRYGHQLVALDVSNGLITSMYNWVFTNPNSGNPVQVSMLMYFSTHSGSLLGFEIYPTPGFTGAIVSGLGAQGVVLVGTGLRLYIAYYDITAKLGVHSAQVYGFGVGLDNLFAAPLSSIPSISEPSTGVCTAGVHNIGYVFTTRNGYTGALSPVFSNGTFRPIVFTSSGGKNIQVTISATLPSYLGPPATYQIVMSTVANPHRYYAVPGATASCADPTVISFSISDADLAATGADFTAHQNLLASQADTNVPPFLPVAIFTYSSRMCYVTIDGSGFPVVYISEPDDYQYITADQHGIYLEGNAQVVQGFSLRGVCYLATQSSLFSCEDNGDVPVNWTPPQKVDGSIGILSPTCVTVNPSLGYAAVASDRGLYIFQGGIFPALPLSYYQQPDWGRINWRLPSQVQVVDDQLNKRFIVIAPLNTTIAAFTNLGGNNYSITTAQNPHLYPNGLLVGIGGGTGSIFVTGPNSFTTTLVGGSISVSVGGTVFAQNPSHQLTWDYTQGDTPQTVMYSINSMGSTNIGQTGYTPGAVAVVQNQPASLQEVWYGLFSTVISSVGPFIRQCDGSETTPYQDLDATGLIPMPINWIYKTNLIPGIDDEAGTLHTFCGMHFRATGNGTIALLASNMDGTKTLVPAASPLTISTTPGIDYLVKWNLNNTEQESIQFQTNAVGVYAVLSLVKAYYTTVAMQR